MTDPTLRRAIETFAFEDAFLEDIGWDQFRRTPLTITIGETTYALDPVAEKRGFQVYRVRPAADGRVPDRKTRLAIHRRVLDAAREHALVFTDAAETRQVWEFPSRRRRNAWPDHTWHAGQDVGGLVAMLRQLEVSVDEEDGLTISDVTGRTEAFDKDKVTKAFYREFSTVRTAFRDAVSGIDALPDREWYASLMLNRLMFLYFIQEKGFLDKNPRYLRDRLERSAALLGPDQFHSFYRSFLLALFHRGLASAKPHAADVRALIGEVPYLNGGLFDPHELEASHDIAVPDTAFAAVFAFFDRWTWTLDYRELRSGREINPDVLGYIFEQTINNKQTGAYYTKEDVTGYIVRNTLLPHLLDEAARECRVAFEGPQSVWRLLRESPDGYIYPAVQQTKRDDAGTPVPFPTHIAAGLTDVAARGPWNAPAPDPWGLPTETWREAVARRQRYTALRETLAAGGITSTAGLVTHNLDIEQFALDVVETAEGPDLVRAVWHALRRVAVLDPTCGSGAFLFAALERLEPLYTACLAQMRRLVAEAQADGRLKGELMSDFRREIALADDRVQHPSECYFVLKRILLDNLYGVDIMPEAVEICKLRLFLKLAAQVSDDRNLEPLPDLDFNVRAGNALVGYATRDSVARALTTTAVRGGAAQGNLLLGGQADALADFEAGLARVQRLAAAFRDQQQDHTTAAEPEAKQTLRDALRALTDTLDRALATEHGVKAGDAAALDAWRERVRPFHWFAEFYGVMERGGFDAIVGNPPYVRLYKVKEYEPRGFATEEAGDLYALVTERSTFLLGPRGHFGLIVPMSLSATEQTASLRSVLSQAFGSQWISHYSGDANPSKLFEGVKYRLDVVLARRDGTGQLLSGPYSKWFAEERSTLFDQVRYEAVEAGERTFGLIPKTGSPVARSILNKLLARQAMGQAMVRTGEPVYAHRVITMFTKAFDFIPYFWNEQDGEKKSDDYKPYRFRKEDREPALAILNSSTFFFYFIALGDCFHCGKAYVEGFPAGFDIMKPNIRARLITLGDALMIDVKTKAVRKVAQSKKTGRVEYDEFWLRLSKPILDEIDAVLAEHYDFTPEELDFIINYDVKYRLGAGALADA